jgi:hypothetical protein
MREKAVPDNGTFEDGFEDPLAVRVGLFVGADDIPAEGWPDTFKPEVIGRILRYLPTDEDVA